MRLLLTVAVAVVVMAVVGVQRVAAGRLPAQGYLSDAIPPICETTQTYVRSGRGAVGWALREESRLATGRGLGFDSEGYGWHGVVVRTSGRALGDRKRRWTWDCAEG